MRTDNAMMNYTRFLSTYSGRKLLEKYSLEKVGIWEIRGEDSNCDLGGAHYRPKLGTVEGKLQDIIMYGVNLDQFWTWGGGGDFEFVGESIPKVDKNTINETILLQEEADRLEARLMEINKALGRK